MSFSGGRGIKVRNGNFHSFSIFFSFMASLIVNNHTADTAGLASRGHQLTWTQSAFQDGLQT